MSYFRGFRRISTFVYIIHTVIGSNLNKWAVVFSIFIAGFSQGKLFIELNFFDWL